MTEQRVGPERKLSEDYRNPEMDMTESGHERGWGYVSTFGGSEVGCRVATKALEIATRPGTARTVQENAAYLRTGLDAVRDRHALFTEIRQLGAIFALRVDGPNAGVQMAAEPYRTGLWARYAGYDRSAIQFKLGLLVDQAHCDEALEKLGAALTAFSDRHVSTRKAS